MERDEIIKRALDSGATNLALIAKRIGCPMSSVWRVVQRDWRLVWKHEQNKQDKVRRLNAN